MIIPKDFYDGLTERGIRFFTGVPDSLLKDFCFYVSDNCEKHITAANEGGAIALATGYHLATGNFGLVYMQNSGLGNCVNPLTSLADKKVYGIPMLLLIGWRGEPGVKDEPQHIHMGEITQRLLKSLDVPFAVLPDSQKEAEKILDEAVAVMRSQSTPYAIVVKKNTFEQYQLKNNIKTAYDLLREEAIKLIVDSLGSYDVVVGTTGMTSRELFEYRKSLGQAPDNDFLTVGSMGHSSSLALGIALSKPNREIYCLDGDGAAIMHLGSMAIIGQQKLKNFKHIIINNGAHDSVGGQPTAGFNVDLLEIAKACGYQNAFRAETAGDVREKLSVLRTSEGPSLLEIRVNKGHRDNLGRPTTTPSENKKGFMKFLSQ